MKSLARSLLRSPVRLAALLVLGCAAIGLGLGSGGPFFKPPQVLDPSDTGQVNGNGGSGAIATDGTRWMATWENETVTSTQYDIMVSTSLDAVEWSAPVRLSASSSGANRNPLIATNGTAWVVVWSHAVPGNIELLASYSQNGGTSWSSPGKVFAPASTAQPDHALAADARGTFVVVGVADDPVPPGPANSETDLYVVRTTDPSQGWSAPVLLDPTGDNDVPANDRLRDRHPALGVNDQGRWVAVWDAIDVKDDSSTSDPEEDILFSRSDDGVTWTEPEPLIAALFGLDDKKDRFPAVGAGGHRFVVTWTRDMPSSGGGRRDLYGATSPDGGSWSLTTPGILTMGPDRATFFANPIASDGSNWVNLWGYGGKVFASRSDDGIHWSGEEVVEPRPGAPDGWSTNNLVTDGRGKWAALWTGNDPQALGDKDMFVTLATNDETCGDRRVEGDEQCDPPGGCCTALCQLASQGASCRPAAGTCDLPEVCTGTSAACPADQKKPGTEQCRAAASACDEPEKCDGLGNDCPPNLFVPAGRTDCSDEDACTDTDTCDGTGGCVPGVRVCDATPSPLLEGGKVKGIKVLCESREPGACEATGVVGGDTVPTTAALVPAAVPLQITKTVRRTFSKKGSVTLKLALNKNGKKLLKSSGAVTVALNVKISGRTQTFRQLLRILDLRR